MELDPAVLDDITWHNAFRFLGVAPAHGPAPNVTPPR
jgi:hypothetical protein